MTQKERRFIDTVWTHYETHGRHSLPWRKTKDSYRILVSEFMLQQTQVARVMPKYKNFLKKFPTFKKLEQASLGDVLKEWQGLGYNRRAKYLHQCAKEVFKDYSGRLPQNRSELVSLPGIGIYTAGAVLAFAYGKPTPIVETNIRSAYMHHFFRNKEDITDTQILKYIERTLDVKHPREWYYALMDYGVYIKQTNKNTNSRSKHYIKQSKFKGSDREIRGAIIRELSCGTRTEESLYKKLTFKEERISKQLALLLEEGMIQKKKRMYTLPK